MTKTELKFRTATSDDAPQLQQLVESAFRAQDTRANWTDKLGISSDFRIHVNDIMTMIAKPESVLLVATTQDGALAGTIGTSKLDDQHARLFMLAVDQNRQCGGLGRQILAYAEGYGQRTWGVNCFGLNVLSGRDQLMAWYSRQGYEETGETTPFPREKHESLALPDDLCFIEFEKKTL
ncbi:unnamed protein product [Penicillium olsonii]|nr:unnamed protein product [Penicillium olsonii]